MPNKICYRKHCINLHGWAFNMKYITIFIVVVLMSNWRRMCNSQTQLLRNKPKFFQRSASFFLQTFKYNQFTLCKCFQSMFLPNVLFRCFRFQAYSELLPLSGSSLLPCGSHITKMLKQPHVFYILVEFLFCRPDIAELELKLSEYTKKMSNLQQMVQELASKVQQDMQWYKSFQFNAICPTNVGFCCAESEIN